MGGKRARRESRGETAGSESERKAGKRSSKGYRKEKQRCPLDVADLTFLKFSVSMGTEISKNPSKGL
eukprot:765023-Hanusia_phi.AAC.2